ncbi:N-acetylmuramoyl-L-alanine amidase [Myxococcus stipitatus DSM 14675]|uniref:N-acetylmuramoyl-L-alanine amidase n=1 Tax=Myxococcus stipitatus (strain DSM 14675 / JCM 12634 / Mx s8) TaxID=1278073 RepID=L7UHP8_MYXSD|nr:peptidoglycan recognition family protein [Myxococcus stipitatus]AGC47087.1 N-acetylmuramoyl-L-alanine amidase [Myxococcus stipitatus DSM 14675]
MFNPIKRFVSNTLLRPLRDEPRPTPKPTPGASPSPRPDTFEPSKKSPTPSPSPGTPPPGYGTGTAPKGPAPLTPPSTDPSNPTPEMQVRPAKSDRYNDRPAGADIDTIVLHHTADGSDRNSLTTLTGDTDGQGVFKKGEQWLKDKKNGKVSSHYMIGKDGTIFQLVGDEKRAWHAGGGQLRDEKGKDVNDRSIGIEIVNEGDGKDGYTEAQYKALEKLVPYLAKRYDVPSGNVVGHKETNPQKKDPSENFDFGRIVRATEKKIQ